MFYLFLRNKLCRTWQRPNNTFRAAWCSKALSCARGVVQCLQVKSLGCKAAPLPQIILKLEELGKRLPAMRNADSTSADTEAASSLHVTDVPMMDEEDSQSLASCRMMIDSCSTSGNDSTTSYQ